MKTNIVSALKYGSILVATIAVAVFVAMTTKQTSNEPSQECVKIRQDVMTNLLVGDSEKVIVPFFEKRGWKYASGSVLGLYNVELHIRRTKVGEDHIIRIYIKVKDGVISHIDVSDLYRFL